MNIALAEDDVVVAADFDFIAIFWTEQHLITWLHRPNIWPDGHHFGPHQSLADLCRCRDEDATGGSAFTFGATQVHENAIVQHLNGEFFAVGTNAVGQSIGGLR